MPLNSLFYNKLTQSKAKEWVAVYYLIGVIGFVVPYTAPLFQRLVPLSMFFNIFLLACFVRIFSVRELLIFLFICVSSIAVEMLGVATGEVFGAYHYGSSLGYKLLGTPLSIGLNWLILSYIACVMTHKWAVPLVVKILTAAALMVGMDVLIEQIAPKMNMWYWEDGNIPLQNYLAWYVLAVIYASLLFGGKVKLHNPLAMAVYLGQLGFFFALWLIL